jgi:uncharacterized spore protein YtfJ
MENQLAQAAEYVERMVERLDVNTVFGELRREGDVAIIPVAQVGATFGFGYGSGEGPAPLRDEEAEPGGMASGGGGGGGGMGSAKPRGIIKLSADGISYEPFVDPVRLGLAGILMVAWNVFWIALAVRAFARK